MFFTDENGVTHIAAFDNLSKVFTVQEVDLEHWQQVVDSTPRLPGELGYQHSARLHEALSEVSGYNMIFQNNFQDNQTTLVRGVGMSQMPEFIRNQVQDYSDVKDRIEASQQRRDQAAQEWQEQAGTPETAAEVFERASRDRNAEPPLDPLVQFGANAEQMTRAHPAAVRPDGSIVNPSQTDAFRISTPLHIGG